MAVTVAQLAVELRIATDPDTPPDEPLASVLSRALRAAKAVVHERVNPATPEALRDIGVIAVASYLFDRPSAAPGARFANAWENSGAGAMLSRWMTRRAVAIGGETEDEDGEAEPMILLDVMLTAEAPISPIVQVDEERRASLQVVPRADFQAVIEGSFLESGEPVEWTRIIPFTNETVLTNDDRLTLNPLVAYRARLLSGGPVRVLLG